jgi:outer membrane protein OmpA-like peptidoglycan-associated protein
VIRAWLLTGAITAAVLALAACHSDAEASDPALPQEGPGQLLILPDSAIAVHPGSTEEQLARFLASDQPAPRTFRFRGSEFQPWQSRPNPPTLRTMYTIAQILRAYPRAKVLLVGHTDNDGTAERNLALSRERAVRMARLLIDNGVAARRIRTEGHGLAHPIADNGTAAGRERNRRIELIVTAK